MHLITMVPGCLLGLTNVKVMSNCLIHPAHSKCHLVANERSAHLQHCKPNTILYQLGKPPLPPLVSAQEKYVIHGAKVSKYLG